MLFVDRYMHRLLRGWRSGCFTLCVLLALNVERSDADEAQQFNGYILRAVGQLNSEFGGKGKDVHADYTHDIQYGEGTIKARKPPLTGCTAAIAEVIATAINLYVGETGDRKPYAHLPAEGWNRMRPIDIRSHIWVDPRLDSFGTADALVTFGVGVRTRFDQLRPGSFINFNRVNGTGHAGVFIGFLDESGAELPSGDAPSLEKIAGFKYFSAQYQTNGMGFGYAFFSNKDGKNYCPKSRGSVKPDCGVVYSVSQRLLNTGHLLAPKLWDNKIERENLRELLDGLYVRIYSTRGADEFALPPNLSRDEFSKQMMDKDTMSLNPAYDNVE